MTWVRVVYLYLFALVGLVMVTIGSAQMVGLGLRTWVLTEADSEMRIRWVPEPPMRVAPDRVARLESDTTLDETTRQALRDWAEDYRQMREERETVDPVRASRQRDLAGALSLLLVGFPLFFYHWGVIRRERAGFGPA